MLGVFSRRGAPICASGPVVSMYTYSELLCPSNACRSEMRNLALFNVPESWLKGTSTAVMVWVNVVPSSPLQVQFVQLLQLPPPLVEYSHTADSTARPGARSRTSMLAETQLAGKVRRTWQVRRT